MPADFADDCTASVRAYIYSSHVPVPCAALHISAAEVNLTAVKMLVEEGHADVLVRDRWNCTPLDEALKMGATQIISFLQPRMAAVQATVTEQNGD